MNTSILITERLILRAIKLEDVMPIFNCWMQDEDVSRYMWWKASSDISEAEDFVDFELNNIESNSWYRWIITTKETGDIIGTCLIYINDDDTPEHWDISYNLGKAYWGKGYTMEAMTKVLEFAKMKLQVKEIITSYAKVNTASANVLHKLGFIDIKEIPYECSGGETVVDGVVCRLEVL